MAIHTSSPADEAISAPVLVQCPATSGLVPTGLFAQSLHDLSFSNWLGDCPDCGEDHHWEPDEAILAYRRDQPPS